MKVIRGLAVLVIVLGVVSLALGGVFVAQGVSKNNLLVNSMRQEQITLGVPSDELAAGEVIDSAGEAQIAGDTVRGHRHGIAATYGDLLGGQQYDPTNPTQLTYAQALNLENYLYLAVLGFGVTQVVMGAGAFMLVVGIALIGTGIAIGKLSRRTSQA